MSHCLTNHIEYSTHFILAKVAAVYLGGYPLKNPCKKPPNKNLRAISHQTKSLLGQNPPKQNALRYKKPSKIICLRTNLPPKTICPLNQLAPETDLPCQEGVLVIEQRLGLECRAQSALHCKPVSGLGRGEPTYTSPYSCTM